MKTGIRRLSAITLLALLATSMGMAYALPQIPHQFYGQVTIEGTPAPNGTLIEVKIGGVTYLTTTTTDGKYGYEPLFKVPADDPATTPKEGGVDGDTVMFYVGGVWAANHTFKSGTVTELGLSLEAPPGVPPSIVSFEPPSPVSDYEGATRTFSITVDQVVDVSWLMNETDVFSELGVTASSYTNTSAPLGTWNVAAVASNVNGTATQTWVWEVSAVPPAPQADFTANVTIGPEPLAVAFTDLSTGIVTSWEWDLDGDGVVDSTEQNPEYVYEQHGIYTVSLTVDGDTETKTGYIVVTPIEIEDLKQEEVAGGQTDYVVNATAEANTTVTLNTTAATTVTVIKYAENPHPDDLMPATALPKYVDIVISDPDAVVWPIRVEMTYTDEEVTEISEEELGLYYWKADAWQRCSDTGVDIEENIVWAEMTEEEASGSPVAPGVPKPDSELPVIHYAEIVYVVGAESARPGDGIIIIAIVTDNVTVESVELTGYPFGTVALMISEPGWPDLYFESFIVPEDTLQGNYTLTIQASDAAGNTNSTELTLSVAYSLTAYNIWITDGWNLISLPLIPDDTSIDAVLDGVSIFAEDAVRMIAEFHPELGFDVNATMPIIESVWAHSAATGEWLYYEPATGAGDLEEMADGFGYWIEVSVLENVTEPNLLTVHGVELVPGPVAPPAYPVAEGWNLIGFKETYTMPTEDYLSSLSGKYSRVYGYSAWSRSFYSVLDWDMEPGQGYWMYATEAGFIAP